jgi:hypothetical protein
MRRLAEGSLAATENDPNALSHRGKGAQWAMFAASAIFFPIPFIIPFWAVATVPVSYLISSGSRVGKIGVAYGLVAAGGQFVISMLLNRLLHLIPNRITRNLLVVVFVIMLAIASLLPIYRPRMDPMRPGVNIMTLFQHGIPVGQ